MSVRRDPPWPGHVPVDERVLGLDRRSVGASAWVVVVAAVMALGLPAADAAVSRDYAIRAGDVVGLSGGVRFVPAAGWTLAEGVLRGQVDRDSSYGGTARLTRGAVAMSVTADSWSGSPAELLDQVRSGPGLGGSGTSWVRLGDRSEPLRTASGSAGLLERYRSVDGDLVLAVVVLAGAGAGTGVQVELAGPPDDVRAATAACVGMIRSIGPVDREGR
jgi:hypothetical protein